MNAQLRPWIVWGTGLFAYVVVILDATAFGVSGLDAANRFGASPGLLPSFVVVQVVTYTAMQVPAGILLDRFGPTAMIAAGVAVMSVAQLAMGLTHSPAVAVGACATVGFGDAFVFISVIRLLPEWFAGNRVPLLTQLTSIGGQLGQVLSAAPFLAILLHRGWAAAYLSAATLGASSVLLTLALGRDRPGVSRSVAKPGTLRTVFGDVATVWSRPGTRLGFFTHLGTQSSITVFALMWGVPYLTTAQGMSRSAAGALLTVAAGAIVVAGVLVGIFSGRHPQRRPGLVLATIGATALLWTVVLALPHRAPVWLLVLLVAVTAAGQPVAIVAFDFARAFNPPAALGTAQGMVNAGGFVASLLVMQTMGLVIATAGGYSFDAFRLAWAAQYVVWVVAAAGVALTARKARSDTTFDRPDTPSSGHHLADSRSCH